MFKKLFRLSFVLVLAAASLQAQYVNLHQFTGPAADGAKPMGSLLRKGNVFYGMTSDGGANNCGTIFKIGADGTGYAILHSFAYSTEEGRHPSGSLIFKGGKLYGMTPYGGANSQGTIFRINLNGTGFALLHSFAGGAADGALPYGSLMFKGGKLYGMTHMGGASDYGTIFGIKANGSGFSVLHSFNWTEGARPQGSLIFSGNKLYGMTMSGGNEGVLFQINPNGTGFQVLHSFTGGVADGANPLFGRLVARGSALYGMTEHGGANGRGVIFTISKKGGGFAVLHSFAGFTATNGTYPSGSLVFGGSKLYGFTQNGGGTFAEGTIFQINPDGTGFEVLHSLVNSLGEGVLPYGEPIYLKSAKTGTVIYGLAKEGGSADLGTVFSLTLE